MTPRQKAANLLLPVGRISRTRYAAVLLAAGLATALLFTALPQAYAAWSFVLLWVVFVASARRLHDRNLSAFFFLLVVVPVVNVGFLLYLLLAPTAAIDPLERQRCLDYFSAEAKLRIFQEREAARYNDVLAQHEERVATHKASADQLIAAGRRIRAAVREIWRRRADELGRIPDQALPLYLRWQERYEAYDAWVEAKVGAIEAMAQGAAPPATRLRTLSMSSQKTRTEAVQEERRFLQRVRLHADSVDTMIVRPLMDEEDDEEWLPRQSV